MLPMSLNGQPHLVKGGSVIYPGVHHPQRFHTLENASTWINFYCRTQTVGFDSHFLAVCLSSIISYSKILPSPRVSAKLQEAVVDFRKYNDAPSFIFSQFISGIVRNAMHTPHLALQCVLDGNIEARLSVLCRHQRRAIKQSLTSLASDLNALFYCSSAIRVHS